MKQDGKFLLMTREEFKVWLEKLPVRRRILLIQEHHTYSPNYSSFKNNHFQLLKSMEAAHLHRGFTQIAQNITTFPDGLIAVCRPFDVVPAGIKGANANGICIENVGNFDAENMTEEQKKTIVFVTAMLCRKFNLVPSTNTIVYHHWYDLNTGKRTNGTGCVKTCPGVKFFGGNTVEACTKYFIPLVIQELQTPLKPTSKKGEVLASSLNCRETPDITGKINGRLPKGAIVTIFKEQNGWYLVNNVTPQWVNAKFIKIV